jgi:tetratricopeptide (TPR) repeat protein
VALLLDLGARAVVAGGERLVEGISRWKEALARAEPGEQAEEVRRRVRHAALGRARVLAREDDPVPALTLLEGALEVAGPEEIGTLLADLLSAAAVKGVNEREEWENAVHMLRRAQGLNPTSRLIAKNLAVALLTRAQQIAETSKPEALRLAEEAEQLAAAQIHLDPNDEGMQETLRNAQQSTAVLRVETGGGTEALFHAMRLGTEQGMRALSTQHHNEGIARLNRGDHDGAIRDLQRALEYEPGSTETQRALASALNAKALRLAEGGILLPAVELLVRARRLRPGDEVLTENLRGISLQYLGSPDGSVERLPREAAALLFGAMGGGS